MRSYPFDNNNNDTNSLHYILNYWLVVAQHDFCFATINALIVSAAQIVYTAETVPHCLTVALA